MTGVTQKEALQAAVDEFYGYGKHIPESLQADMEAAIRAYLEARGLVMVPYDPTTAMMSAVHYTKGEFVDVYRAMLAAAPDPFK